MPLIPKLNLNRHPRDVDNYSLVDARNIKLSKDISCITNEEGTTWNDTIKSTFDIYYNNINHNIIGTIPCNKELVIFVYNNGYLDIWRYFEDEEKCIYYYGIENNNDNIKLRGIKCNYNDEAIGAFTYNYNNELIISFCISEDVIRTLNLGLYKIDNNSINVDVKDTPNVSEVFVDEILDYEYKNGNAYKGWYYFFIRYKIDNNDYTQWYNIGYPIYNDSFSSQQITKYSFHYSDNGDVPIVPSTSPTITPTVVSVYDNISDNKDFCNKTIKLYFSNKNNKTIQIGFICVSKSYTKAYRTKDLNNINSIIVNGDLFETYNVADLITPYYNYKDVKSIINYNNRLYIGNYKELPYDNLQEYADKVKVTLNHNIININTGSGTIREKNRTYTIGELYNIDDTYIIKFKYNSYYNNTNNSNNNGPAGGGRIFTGGGVINNIVKCKPSELILTVNNTVNNTVYETLMYKDILIDNSDVNIEIYKNGLFERTEILSINRGVVYGNLYDKNSVVISNHNKCGIRTLIPGEIYNFYIHYVDIYGHATNGFKLNSKQYIINSSYFDDKGEDETPLWYLTVRGNESLSNKRFYKDFNYHDCIVYSFTYNNKIYYAHIPRGEQLLLKDSKGFLINYTPVVIANIPTAIEKDEDVFIDDRVQVERTFVKLFQQYNTIEYSNYTWDDIIEFIITDKREFIYFENTNNESLFGIPIIKCNDTEVIQYGADFNNIEIPNGYVGYYISYEKFEPRIKYRGIASSKYIEFNPLNNNIHSQTIEYIYVYCEDFDLSDSIDLKFDTICIRRNKLFNVLDKNSIFLSLKDVTNNNCDIKLPVKSYNIVVANAAKHDNIGKGTYIVCQVEKTTLELGNIFYVELLNSNKNIYINKNKTLIKCTNTIYGKNSIDNVFTFNGFISESTALVYNQKGIFMNDGDITIRFNDNKKVYGYKSKEYNSLPFIYYSFLIYDNVLRDSKCFKNDPKPYVYVPYIKDSADNYNNKNFDYGSFVTPADSIDLFENRQTSMDELNPIALTNYRTDITYTDKFAKTIRRSHQIKDETKNNEWRLFNIDAYKNITENKGEITNILGIGDIFLAHTEHSLFVFSITDILKSNNSVISIGDRDIFDVQYKELLTSTLGYGGLQDRFSWIVGEYGYIFYNNDFNTFYKYNGGGNVEILDKDIFNWSKHVPVTNVRFVEDKDNNRVIVAYDANSKRECISYNYGVGKFISFHDYLFSRGFNTKRRLYMLSSNKFAQYSNFVKRTNYVNGVENPQSVFSIIVNDKKYITNWLEFINYKITKLDVVEDNVARFYSPVEGEQVKYSGDKLRVFNNYIDTGIIDITTDAQTVNAPMNWQKPYWNYGNWNFNFFINEIRGDNKPTTEHKQYEEYGDAYGMTRLYGEYFIFKFMFNHDENIRYEFDDLQCVTTTKRN